MSDKLATTEQFKVDSNTSLKILSSIELRGDCTLSDIRKHGTPPISALVKDGNKAECYKLIKTMTIALNQYIGISWSDFQVTEVAKEFYSKYFYFTQLDLMNFFRKCRNMEFEKILSANQFTPLIFMQWAAQYDYEWLNESVNQSYGVHKELTYDQDRGQQIAIDEQERRSREADPNYQKQQRFHEKRSKEIQKGNADEKFFEQNITSISKILENYKNG